MPKTKPDSLPPRSADGPCIFRTASIDRSGIDRENRSFPIVLATENPVRVYDWMRGEVMDEVLRVDGIQRAAQVPMLDTHDRTSTQSVYGSIRELQVAGGELRARAYFASDPSSTKTFNDYADGHLTDFSIGVQARQEDISYEGNTRSVNRSRLLEGSAVVIGADPNAKALLAQRAYLNPEQVKDEAMLAKMRELLVQRGLKADATDAEALEFAEKSLERAAEKPAESKATDNTELIEFLRSLKTESKPKPVEPKPAVDDAAVLRAERTRVSDLNELFRQHEGRTTAEERTKWIADGASVSDVSAAILRKLTPNGVPTNGGRIEGGVSQREKVYAAAESAILVRAFDGAGLSMSKVMKAAESKGDFDSLQRAKQLQTAYEKPAAGYEKFRYVRLPDIARAFCEEAGERCDGLPAHEVVTRAIAMSQFITRSVEGGVYNTTGSFSNLMLDAAKKLLLASYDEAPATYQTWVRKAPSTADFKNMNRIRFGELPDPEIVAENGVYPEKKTSDSRESYRVEKYGEIFSISMEAIINDDMNAISRIPQMQGNAMRRKINKVCYAVLTANAPLSDSGALFNNTALNGTGGHANLASTALAVGALDTAYAAMMVQQGLLTGADATVLGIVPRYLIVPAALAATASGIVNSIAPPLAGGSAAGNSNTHNMYGPNGERPLQLVVDAQLDAASTTQWYLAADPSTVDTVEITFLQGEESPVLDREMGFRTDGVFYKIRQTFAAKAIDFRGLYKGNA